MKYESDIYSYINNVLFFFNFNTLTSSTSVEWIPFKETSLYGPIEGLIDYGMGVTNSGKLAIFGGLKESKDRPKFQRSRYFSGYSDFWIIKLKSGNPEFLSAGWKLDGNWGYTRMINLGGEILGVLNGNLKTQIMAVDLDSMISYPFKIINLPDNLRRTAFGIAELNSTDFLIYGGYNIHGNVINGLNPNTLFYRMSLSSQTITENESLGNSESVRHSIIATVVVFSILVVFFTVFYMHKNYSKFSQKIQAAQTKKRDQELKDVQEVLEQAKVNFENKIKNLQDDPEFTASLNMPNYGGLYIPGYREKKMGRDFRVDSVLTSGGMGSISLGKILNGEDIISPDQKNQDFIIKTPTVSIPRKQFIQEVCIHEVFRNNKYFAQLVCYSEEPQALVLKYYPMGSLTKLLFPSQDSRWGNTFTYTFEIAFNIAYRLAWAVKIMHSRRLFI